MMKESKLQTLLNPFFLSACLIFLIHQYMQIYLQISIPWIDNYLDDLLCMPIFLNFLLIERKILFRLPFNHQFTLLDTALMILVLSLIFEEIYPLLNPACIKDHWDYFYYFVGGLLFYCFINKNSNGFLIIDN